MFHLACCQLTKDRAAVDNSIPAEQSIYSHGLTLTFRQNRRNYTEIKLTLIVQHSLCLVLQKGESDLATGEAYSTLTPTVHLQSQRWLRM